MPYRLICKILIRDDLICSGYGRSRSVEICTRCTRWSILRRACMPVGRGRSGKQGVPGAWRRIVSVYRLIKTFDFTSCRRFRMFSGAVMTMPGLPRAPAADTIRLDDQGRIEGLF